MLNQLEQGDSLDEITAPAENPGCDWSTRLGRLSAARTDRPPNTVLSHSVLRHVLLRHTIIIVDELLQTFY